MYATILTSKKFHKLSRFKVFSLLILKGGIRDNYLNFRYLSSVYYSTEIFHNNTTTSVLRFWASEFDERLLLLKCFFSKILAIFQVPILKKENLTPFIVIGVSSDCWLFCRVVIYSHWRSRTNLEEDLKLWERLWIQSLRIPPTIFQSSERRNPQCLHSIIN